MTICCNTFAQPWASMADCEARLHLVYHLIQQCVWLRRVDGWLIGLGSDTNVWCWYSDNSDYS